MLRKAIFPYDVMAVAVGEKLVQATAGLEPPLRAARANFWLKGEYRRMFFAQLLVCGMGSSPRHRLGALIGRNSLHLAVKGANISLRGASKHFAPRGGGEFHASVFRNCFSIAVLPPHGDEKLKRLVAGPIAHCVA